MLLYLHLHFSKVPPTPQSKRKLMIPLPLGASAWFRSNFLIFCFSFPCFNPLGFLSQKSRSFPWCFPSSMSRFNTSRINTLSCWFWFLNTFLICLLVSISTTIPPINYHPFSPEYPESLPVGLSALPRLYQTISHTIVRMIFHNLDMIDSQSWPISYL